MSTEPRPGYAEVVEAVRRLDGTEAGGRPYRIAVLRNVTVDGIAPYLRYACYMMGLRASLQMGSFDAVLQDALDAGGAVHQPPADLILIILKLETLSPLFCAQFADLSASALSRESDRVIEYVASVLGGLRRHTAAPILLHTFESPTFPAFGLLDIQSANRHLGTIRRLNGRLLQEAEGAGKVYLVDTDVIQARLGYERYWDARYWHMARAPFSREACQALAEVYAVFIRALTGRIRKCLVLDCDNTLWGGILGEDGFAGIQLGPTHPGSAFQSFQRVVRGLKARGVLLALCSRNNEADVLEVLDRHPEMLLRREDFAALQVNWRPKPENLRAIAADLNIGLDSLVFVDDSAFETTMVRAMLPEVATIQLPKDPALYADTLRACDLFDGLTHSVEDQRRTEMYRAAQAREAARARYAAEDLERFLCDLGMELLIGPADPFTIPRIAQLTQRTNQFNLTSARYAEGDLGAMAASPDAEVRCVSLRDCFGDLGIVGVVILRVAGESCQIDTFLLSCRAIGRGIEAALMGDCHGRARARGCSQLVGTYVATAKNGQVADFYPRMGFRQVSEGDGKVHFARAVEPQVQFPSFFKTVAVKGRSS